MTSEFDLQWGSPTVQRLPDGLRSIRRAMPTDAFWSAWRTGKEGLRAKGYGVTQVNGVWLVTHWSIPTPAPAASVKADVPLDPVRPLHNARGLVPYQIEPTAWLLRSLRQFGAALDASDTGVGKTYMAMAVARELNLVPLVVCPKVAMPGWERVARHMNHPVRIINYEKVRMGNTPWCKRRSVRVGPDRAVETFVWSKEVRLLFFDEAHKCAGTDTLNSSLMIGAALQGTPTLAISATAVENPLHMRALGFLLQLHGLKDFWDWAAAHGCYRNQWDGWEFGGTDEDLLQIRREVFPARGIRVTVKELGSQFPDSQVSTELIPVDDVEAVNRSHEAVAEALERVRRQEDADEESELNGAEHLVARLRARQTAELQKLPAVAELTKAALDEGRSVFITVNFNDSITALRQMLKVPVSVIIGGQSSAERDAEVQRFQSNRVHVCIANGNAGGQSVNLHDVHHQRPRTALHLPGEDCRLEKQRLGRVRRQGGTVSIQRILYAAGTVEEQMADRMEAKLRHMDLFNDGPDTISP